MSEQLPVGTAQGETLPVLDATINRRSAIANTALAIAGLRFLNTQSPDELKVNLENIQPVNLAPHAMAEEEQLSVIADLRVVPEPAPIARKVKPEKRPYPSHISRKRYAETLEVKYIPKYDKDGNYIPLSGGCWGDLGHGESHDDYENKNNPINRGRWQFDQGTWDSNCAHKEWIGKDPADAPPEVQDDTALRLQARRGWGPWPHQGRKNKLAARSDYVNQYFGVIAKRPKNTAAPAWKYIEAK